MANAFIGEPRTYTILATGNVGAQPSSNLLNDEPGLIYESADLTNVYFELDLGSATAHLCTIGAMAILGMLPTPGNIRWRGATSQANLTAAPSYDSGTLVNKMTHSIVAGTARTTFYAKSLHVPATAQAYRYWRVDITPSGYSKFQAWRLLLCDVIQPAENISIGAEFGVDDRSNRRYARNGRRIIDPTIIVPTFQGEWPWLTQAERVKFRQLLIRKGGTTPVLFVLDSDDTTTEDEILYGDLEKTCKISFNEGSYGFDLAIVAIAP